MPESVDPKNACVSCFGAGCHLVFLLWRRLAFAFTAVTHCLFNIRCARGRRVDFEERVFRPVKDLAIEAVSRLNGGSRG